MDPTPEQQGPVDASDVVSPALVSPAEERTRAVNVRLELHLARARARLVALARLQLAAGGLRLFVGTGLAIALASALLPTLDLRAVAPLSAAAIAVGLAIAYGEARRRADGLAVAARLARTQPPLADELHSLLQLAEAEHEGRLTGGTAFLLLLCERVADGFDSTPVERCLPLEGGRRALGRSVLLCALGLGLVHLVSPRLLPTTWAAIRRGPPRDTAVPAAPPIVGDLELELHPPAYTGLPPRIIPASSGELRALRGTEVLVRARSLVGAVRTAKLRLEPDTGPWQTVAVEVERPAGGPPSLHARFVVDAPGRYRYMLSRWTGRAIEPEGHRIEIDPDLAPRVEVRAPADPLELEAPRPVELGLELEDDFGLGEISLAYRIGEEKEQRLPIAIDRPTPRRARGVYLWETGVLEREHPLPPGAKITYWIEARDNDAVGGPKLGRSRVFTLVMRGKTDPAKLDRANLEALLEATLGALADRLDGAGTDETRHGALVAVAARFAAVARPSKEQLASAALQRLAGEISQRLSRLATEEAGPAGPRAVAEKLNGELERDVLALDDLRGRRRVEEMARIGGEMKRARDQLKRLFDELKSATSDTQREALKREIERKLMELEARMAELRRAAADAEGEVPDEFLNKEAIGKQDVTKGVDGIREMLERGDLDKAMAELDRMSRSLDKLTSSLDRGRSEQREASDPAAEQALRALENDLADLSREEREVEREAQAIRERAAERADRAGGSMKTLHDKLRPKLAELERRADEQARDGRLVDREDLERMKARARAVGRALEANDLDEAQGMALDVRRLAQGLSLQLKARVEEAEAEAQARVGDGPSPILRRGAERMGKSEELAQQIESELLRAERGRGAGLDEGDRQRLEELRRRQQQAMERGEAISRRMAQADQPGMGGLPDGARREVDGARASIGESGRQLQRPAPGRGAEHAGQAAEKLEAARKQVSDARQRGDREENGSSSQRRDEPVRIPGADDSAAPRAFREELLDAMKRGAPRRFEEQVQRFYEELVR